MEKKNQNNKSTGNKSGKVREGHRINDGEVRSWQPIVDRTTKPPKGK